MGVPVKVEFEPVAFNELEKLAAEAGTSVRALVETTVVRALDRRRQAIARSGRDHTRRLTTSDIAEVRRLLKEGFTDVAIAERIGCHMNTVYRWKQKIRREESNA